MKMSCQSTSKRELFSNHTLFDDSVLLNNGSLKFSHLFKFSDTLFKDHEVQGIRTLPGVTYLEMIREAISRISNVQEGSFVKLSDILFYNPLKLGEGEAKSIEGLVSNDGTFCIKEGEITLVTGDWNVTDSLDLCQQDRPGGFEELENETTKGVTIYSQLRQLGYFHGPFFKNLEKAKILNQNQVVAELKKSDRNASEKLNYYIDPGVLDSTTLTPFVTDIIEIVENSGEPYIPFSIEEFNIYGRIPDQCYAKTEIHMWNNEAGRISIGIYDLKFNILVRFKNLTFKKVHPLERTQNSGLEDGNHILHHLKLIQQSLPKIYKKPEKPLFIFSPDLEFENKIRNIFKSHENLIFVRHGTQFQKTSEREFLLDPINKEHYIQLFEYLDHDDILPSQVIHCHALVYKEKDDATLEQRIYPIESLFVLSQAIRTFKPSLPCKLISVMSSSNFVSEGIRGLLACVSLEHRTWKCKSIEVCDETRENTAEIVVNEVSNNDNAREVLYKASKRYSRTIEPISQKSYHESVTNPLIPYGGVCVISGGLGDLGLEVSYYLAKKYGARIALISRRSIPPKAEWEKSINDPKYPEKIKKILLAMRKIQFLGGEVLLLKADVSCQDQLQDALKKIRAKWGQINAVFHLAGTLSDRLLINCSLEDLHNVIRPKVQGALNLDKFTQKESLSYFIIFSSIVSILGNLGQACYCVANAMLDSFARTRAEQGRNPGSTKVFNWGAWKNTGMAEANLALAQNLQILNIKPISVEIAIQALDQSLYIKENQLIITKISD